ncbi:TauD-domain-containing protein [Mycena indigotica]|uniref:TauD-domain-containing protein n=1 Tax=Mycena indigotica TaxID=2126181 RepID=A0A8H6SEL0_9AGAR|nr:TauD-domain-containing protein [Mycena indigotica]KAF7296922.1 TauD-domain-containing protein [Mycena indigotica]
MTPDSEPIVTYDINIPYQDNNVDATSKMKYPQYKPTWDPVWFEPLPEFVFVDPATRAASHKPHLLSSLGVVSENLTPKMGTVLRGVDLTELTTNAMAKDELALLIAERKIVVFPDQEAFINAGPDVQQGFMDYFGKRNYQPVSGSIPGHPGFHIIHRDGNRPELEAFFARKTTSCLWHQDVSYERQPPGYVMLALLDGPKCGGDTVFAATDDAFSRLSPTLQNFLSTLRVTHSSANMLNHTKLAGGIVRKDPVTSIHPLVRVHPITGARCLFINGEFITGAVGLKDVEWAALSDFLLKHIIESHDVQVRVHWQPKTVVMFDNRSTLHTAVVDYVDDDGAQPRHIFRLAAMAEIPMAV